MNLQHRMYQFYLFLCRLATAFATQVQKTVRFAKNSFQEETFYFVSDTLIPASAYEYNSPYKAFIYIRDQRLFTSVDKERGWSSGGNIPFPHTVDILEAHLTLNATGMIREHDLTEFFQNTRYVVPPPLPVWVSAWALEQRMILFPSLWTCLLKISTVDGFIHEFNVWGATDPSAEERLWESVHTPFQMHRQVAPLRIQTPLSVKEN